MIFKNYFLKLKMGIKKLVEFLRSKFPDVFKPIHLSDLAYKKVAIDIFYYLCIYKYRFGERFLFQMLRMISILRKNDIHCVVVFDGKAPADKDNEKKERRENKEKAQDNISRVEDALENFRETGIIDEILLDFQKKRKLEIDTVFVKKSILNVKGIEGELVKMKKQLFQISPKNIADFKRILTLIKVPYIEAKGEAELLCSSLCLEGKIDAVLSDDTDVLAYTTPIFITKIDFAESACMRIDYTDLLKNLNLTSEQFLDFCILCGTDYNKNIPGIGVVKAYSLITKYKKIENIKGVDTAGLNHIRVRELFHTREKYENDIPYCGDPDFQALNNFLISINVGTDLSTIVKNFTKEIIFES